jgi:Holliday junction resolvasome, DNA-binding subunit
MIAKLTGLVDSTTGEGAVLDVNGVGYLVFCSPRTLARLPAKGAPASLLVETHVREDHIHLYGFADLPERDWFRLLTTVQGVGAKLALAVLGVLGPTISPGPSPPGTRRACRARPAWAEARGPHRRRAQGQGRQHRHRAGAGRLPEQGAEADAVSALVNLGYRRAEAYQAVATATRRLGGEAPVDQLIRAGLQELSQ